MRRRILNAMPRRSLLLLLAATLAACATATPYQPMKDGVGYGEQKLEDNRYRVWFAGNSKTPREAVEDYVLYRAAELALENGYDYFVLSDRSTEAERHRGGSALSIGIGGIRFGGRSAISIGTGIGIPLGGGSAEYYGQADVTLMKGRKPAQDLAAYDARQVKNQLQRSVARSLLQ